MYMSILNGNIYYSKKIHLKPPRNSMCTHQIQEAPQNLTQHNLTAHTFIIQKRNPTCTDGGKITTIINHSSY